MEHFTHLQHRFQLYNDTAFHKQVESQVGFETMSLNFNRHAHLTVNV